jgi:2-(1,2-epoxy-1,2-dihydrophenyl)acetyl-CoA isomerase
MEILKELINGVCRITLNRPSVFNSFNKTMAMQLQDVLDDCTVNPEIRAVLITGEGKAFCAGQDLAEAVDPEGPELKTIVRDHYNPIIIKIRELEKPVIAAVNGVAAGAGANIALACDIVVAKKNASFIQAFSKIGLIPDSGGTYFLPRLVGMQKAMALMMTGDKVSADEAERMNMIYKVFDEDSFEEEAMKLAENLATMPTRGLGLTKKAVNLGLFNSLEDQLDLEESLQTEAGETDDFTEGVNAFIQKRPAVFKGR